MVVLRSILFLFILSIFLILGFIFWRKKIGEIRDVRQVGGIRKDKVGEVLEDLTLEQKIGQLVLTGIEEEEMNEKEIEMIKEASISGFILLSKNIKSSEKVKGLTSEIQAIATVSATHKLPILISVDQEGGEVSRIEFPGFETIAQWQIESESQAYEVGKKNGSQLKNLGIDLNFSPVVEVLRNPNSYLGQTGRYFVGDEQRVIQLSGAMIKGMRGNGVIGVIKHFPGGLGRTGLNPHDVLSEVNISREELEKDLVVFKRLIGGIGEIGEIRGIMVTHLLYPQVDKENPVAISEIFIKDILRDDLGFNGVVIVDDLNMGAVVKNYDPAEYGVKAILAGADLLIIIDKEMAMGVKDRLKQAVEDGILPQERLDGAVERVLRIKFLIAND